MKVTTFEPLRRATLPLALIAAGMLAGCSGGAPESASADASATPGE